VRKAMDHSGAVMAAPLRKEYSMGLFENLLKNNRNNRHHPRYGNRYDYNDDEYHDDHRGRSRHGDAQYYARTLKPYVFRLFRNKKMLIAAGVVMLFLLLGAIALIMALAPMVMKLVKLLEQYGIKGVLDLINKNGIKGLLDLISQILDLFREGGGKG
jgi:hypothetical protein